MKVEEITSRPQPSCGRDIAAMIGKSPVPFGMMCGGDPKRKFFLMELFRPPPVRIPAFQRTR